MKTIKIASIIIFSAIAASHAQTTHGYKNQFPVKQAAYTSSNLVPQSFVSYNEASNYKQHVYRLGVQPGKETLLSCCTTHAQSFAASYKQPYSKPLHKGCETGFVCADKVQLDCCKL